MKRLGNEKWKVCSPRTYNPASRYYDEGPQTAVVLYCKLLRSYDLWVHGKAPKVANANDLRRRGMGMGVGEGDTS
jgi:hypothetical protein